MARRPRRRPLWRQSEPPVQSVPRNIETKAVLLDARAAHATAARLSGTGPRLLLQEDVFFPCAEARLKLRIFAPDRGELIRYQRADKAQARSSVYQIAPTSAPGTLREILTATLGMNGSVKKRRSLYLIGQTRVHIDEVEGLGEFLEFECVLQAEQSDAEGKRVVTELLSQFGIEQGQLVAEAYVDLLAHKADARASSRKAAEQGSPRS